MLTRNFKNNCIFSFNISILSNCYKKEEASIKHSRHFFIHP
jgi:hypothetical protein